MSIDNFVDSVVYKDATDHAYDFANILNESSDKESIISVFLDELDADSRFTLEVEMDFVI